jgi:hypothetical protein
VLKEHEKHDQGYDGGEKYRDHVAEQPKSYGGCDQGDKHIYDQGVVPPTPIRVSEPGATSGLSKGGFGTIFAQG